MLKTTLLTTAIALSSIASAEPYWQEASQGTVGPSPVYVHSVGGSPEYVCQVGAAGGYIPGVLSPGNRFCTFIHWGGHRSTTYRVLQDPHGDLMWINKNSFDPRIHELFLGGWKASRPSLYICRPDHDRYGYRYAGALEGDAGNGVCFLPNFYGQQDQTFDYEVLVYRP
ncbi:MAG: DUF3421 domain-containing protein [Pseudobacteriovorax sp.]|nr:DUF3421 domain-containing protein [Pseudobacteriovorax sp.]